MRNLSALVTVIDDDESVRESLPDLLREFGFSALAFDSAERFLASRSIDATRCIILDIAMPGMSGPALQQELINRGLRVPIIFITARTDATEQAILMNKGAVDCLLKPFGDHDLRGALDQAFDQP
jgi:FixJ family two-component response regulator